MTTTVPIQIRRAYHQRRLRMEADFPDRIIVSPSKRFMPAPARVTENHRKRRHSSLWVSSYEDNGQKITLHPYRELYDDPSNGIRDLSEWLLLFGDGRKTNRRDQTKRWWLRKPEENLTPEEEARKRRELAKKLFPLVKKPVRKMLFSEEVQKELMQTFDCMAQSAIREGRIQDCKADRDDYRRTLQYVCWSLAAKYDETRPGNEGRTPASLLTFIKNALGTKVLDMKRSRYALKRLGDLFTVSIYAVTPDGELDPESFMMHLDEHAEDGRKSVRECDENMDIQVLRGYLASPRGKRYEKAFNLLFLDGLSIEDAAKEMGVTYSAFKFNLLRPLREICRNSGFASRRNRQEEGKTMKKDEIAGCYSPVITASYRSKRMKGTMEDDIRQAIDRLAALDHEALKSEYLSRFGGSTTFGDVFMRRRLAQQLQEDRLGGLTPTEIEILSRVIRKDARANPRASRKANPAVRGVTYTRMYKGRLVSVRLAGYNQFEYEGRLYPSLTACVKEITGMHYSGGKFFRLGGAPCNK